MTQNLKKKTGLANREQRLELSGLSA